MHDVFINPQNLKKAMSIALDIGANIEVIPELMKEHYPRGSYRLCNDLKVNFIIMAKKVVLLSDTDKFKKASIPPVAFYKITEITHRSIPFASLSKELMTNRTLRKEFIQIFNKTLRELKR